MLHADLTKDSFVDGTLSAQELHDPVGTSRLSMKRDLLSLPRPGQLSSRTSEEGIQLIIRMLQEQQASIKSEIETQHALLRGAIDERLLSTLKDPHSNGEAHEETEALLATNGEAYADATNGEHAKALHSDSALSLNFNPQEHEVEQRGDSCVSEGNPRRELSGELQRLGTHGTPSDHSKSQEESHFSIEIFPKDSPFGTTTCVGKIKSFIIGPLFDLISGACVIMNTVIMFIDLDRHAISQARSLGIEVSSIWEGGGNTFELLEHIFNSIFVLELVLRFWVLRFKMCREMSILFDMFIVGTSCFDAYVMPYLMNVGEGKANLAFARLARLLRIVRVLRAFRAAALFSELRVLIRTLISSIMALIWSALLLGFMILSSGILMAQLMAGFIQDENANENHRLWAYLHYGGASRATYTMFEATLSGGWPNYARPVIENVNAAFAIFWIIYVVTVIFAVIRVISALFLRTTMTAASNDDEMMVMGKMKEKDKFAKKLKKFFSQADKSGDGMLGRGEFNEIIQDVKVQAWLQVLELEVYEVTALFNLLDDGTGEINCDEFVGGCIRLKGNARAIDSIAIMHEQHKIYNAVCQVSEAVKVLWGKILKNDTSNPWQKSFFPTKF